MGPAPVLGVEGRHCQRHDAVRQNLLVLPIQLAIVLGDKRLGDTLYPPAQSATHCPTDLEKLCPLQTTAAKPKGRARPAEAGPVACVWQSSPASCVPSPPGPPLPPWPGPDDTPGVPFSHPVPSAFKASPLGPAQGGWPLVPTHSFSPPAGLTHSTSLPSLVTQSLRQP